jgi:hypothetical protein
MSTDVATLGKALEWAPQQLGLALKAEGTVDGAAKCSDEIHVISVLPRYRTEHRPFTPERYTPYLTMYGHMYGDMSDPAKRAETIASLRRRDARSLASACRALREDVARTPTTDLLHELKVKRYQIEECVAYRPWNIRNADIHSYRMIVNELKRRGEI